MRARAELARASMPDRWRRDLMHRRLGDASSVRRRSDAAAGEDPGVLQSKTIVYVDCGGVVQPVRGQLRSEGRVVEDADLSQTLIATARCPTPRSLSIRSSVSSSVAASSIDVQIRPRDDLLPAGARHAGARMLVHQHGRSGQELLHNRSADQGWALRSRVRGQGSEERNVIECETHGGFRIQSRSPFFSFLLDRQRIRRRADSARYVQWR